LGAQVITGRFKRRGATESARFTLPEAARIGLRVLDEAHAAMLFRLNAAHRALSWGDQGTARLQLEMLRVEMAAHFDVEEQIMQALKLGAMRRHIRSHAASTAHLDGICKASLARGVLRTDDLDLCFQALVDEMIRSDVDLKSHFQAMGRSRSVQQRGA